MIKKGLNLTKCCGVCYYEEDINNIKNFCISKGLHYYYIKHNGFNEEQENDTHKEHWHFIIESDSQHRFIINSMLSETLKENLFQKCDNVHSYLRYMIHIDYLDKEHYEIKDINSNVDIDLITSYINDVVVDKKELDRETFNMLCDLILSKDITSFKQVIEYCRNNNLDYKTNWTMTLVQLLKVVW